jgi:hypothetical protein
VRVVPGGIVGAAGDTIGWTGITLTFPAGAVDTNTVVTIASATSLPDTTRVLQSSAYVLGPSPRTFSAPVTVRLHYTPGLLPADTKEDELVVHRWDGQAWEPLADASVDTVTNSAQGRTTTFSLFALVRVPKAPTVPEWRRVAGHPGENWASRWGDWTVAAGRLWVVENQRQSTEAARIHWTSDGAT